MMWWQHLVGMVVGMVVGAAIVIVSSYVAGRRG
jgi:hypothetical protein